MSVQINIDPISYKGLTKRFKLLEKHYPEETFRAIVAILFDIKRLAQEKITADKHILTARLINSIFVKTPKQKYAKTVSNKLTYSDNENNTFSSDLKVPLNEGEGAVGTNVEYALKIENLDSYLEHGVKTVDTNKWFQKIPQWANRKVK